MHTDAIGAGQSGLAAAHAKPAVPVLDHGPYRAVTAGRPDRRAVGRR
jgi:hypothetical protein